MEQKFVFFLHKAGADHDLSHILKNGAKIYLFLDKNIKISSTQPYLFSTNSHFRNTIIRLIE